MVLGAQVKGGVARKRAWLLFLVIIVEARNLVAWSVSQLPAAEQHWCPLLPGEGSKRGTIHDLDLHPTVHPGS